MTSPTYCFELLRHEALPADDCHRLQAELGYGVGHTEQYALAQILESLVVAAVPAYRAEFASGLDVVAQARWLVTQAAADCRVSAKKQAAGAVLVAATDNLWVLLALWCQTRKGVRHLQLEDAKHQKQAA